MFKLCSSRSNYCCRELSYSDTTNICKYVNLRVSQKNFINQKTKRFNQFGF